MIRAEPRMIETLQHFAARQGRSAAETARIAIEIYLVRAMVDALDNDEAFVAEIRVADPAVDLAAFRAQAEADLARLEEKAFPKPTALQQLAPVMRAGGRAA